ncbi:hypothetical protein NUW58_g9918 [Xylaria curta]|uniref:Uncharacterized protein n=1 Tax=Xylaria curta TaxID=42375 RepID=A0ACC1MU30_9PEZI|nr:hypothetical protein NUW58_g9918 [Xylaria curta]
MASTADHNSPDSGADSTPADSVSRTSTLNTPLQPTMSFDINLPNRTLSNGANLDEYIVETREGQIPGPIEPDGQHRYRLVTFQPGDPENPKNWRKPFKWWITMVVAITCLSSPSLHPSSPLTLRVWRKSSIAARKSLF